ncbi:hypothetical protein IHE56_15595 [Streptomyces sp. ID01-12c]|uniref:hypothetical protein n=1 Tax=Streptomyces caniscabiei TaxID=2746961 RepID=UPI00178277FE|nr:hypothetical protein [Streptomyces caniscabiei]MBD9703480.1 hypothetical protein [Streptomyces caniscabiei]MDX3726736.1 hypothetical protein [Streptomyces caniscabiei]
MSEARYNILVVSDNSGRGQGGAEVFNQELAEALARRHNVTLFAYLWEENVREALGGADKCFTEDWTRECWANLSETYAAAAEGPVTVFAQYADTRSILYNRELPTLHTNGDVGLDDIHFVYESPDSWPREVRTRSAQTRPAPNCSTTTPPSPTASTPRPTQHRIPRSEQQHWTRNSLRSRLSETSAPRRGGLRNSSRPSRQNPSSNKPPNKRSSKQLGPKPNRGQRSKPTPKPSPRRKPKPSPRLRLSRKSSP